MKSCRRVAGLVALLGHNFGFAHGGAVAVGDHSQSHALVSPVTKVIQLLTDLEFKIKMDGEKEAKAFKEFQQWCQTSARDKRYEIKTAKANIEDLTADISKAEADISAGGSKIGELASTISTNEADLKAATEIRKNEATDFQAVEAELVEVIDTLDRAIVVLERKMRGTTLMQSKVNTQDMTKLVEVLGTVLDAAALSLQDKQRLLALAQGHSVEEDDAAELGAPAPEVYRSHSEGIVDVLEDLREKAETQLTEVRKQETSAKHNYNMLRQSLEDEISVDSKDMDQTKTAVASTSEAKATAEGDLAQTKKDLADAEAALELSSTSCMTSASDHEASVKSLQEELEALAAAKKAIMEAASGAEATTYGSTSLLQLAGSSYVGRSSAATHSRLSTHADLAGYEIVNLVRRLAKSQHSYELAQLAGRIQAAITYGASSGEDPFAKVKALIVDLIDRLQKDAGHEASHKAYCDKEMAGTKEKTDGLTGTLDQLSAKIDQKKSSSVMLKNDVQQLQAELADLTKSQLELDTVRSEEHKVYVQKKADLEQGLSGVRMALKILREYYASSGEDAATASFAQQPEVPVYHSKSAGAGTSIIGMLEVVESDFGKGLAQAEMDEDSAATDYEKVTMQNKISKTVKDQDVKYKTNEASALDKDVADLISDRDSAQAELDAVLEYSKGIRAACVQQPMSYEERQSRREAEIAGLREALRILAGDAVLMQRHQFGLRGTSARHLS